MFLRDTSTILNRNAIVDEFENQFTYKQLEDLSLRYLTIIPKRSLILILCDYSIETVAFYYCQMTNHAVPILVDKNLNIDLLWRIIETYEPQFVWCTQEIAERLRDLVSNVVLRGKGHILAQTFFQSHKINPELALLLTTSGSTGSLKLVRLSYDNLRYNIKAYSEQISLQEDDRAITTLPMYYCYGLSILHMHWLVGACVYVTEYSVLHMKFWDFFEKSKITNFAGVPYTYAMLEKIGFLDKTYETLRFMTQAGAKLPEEQQLEFGKRLHEKNVKLYICYGQTEATTYLSLLSYKNVSRKLGSVGMPIPGVDISVVNPNDRGEGELVCRGKSISMGYAGGKGDLDRGNDWQGCLWTGDIVSIDGEGDIFIKGRKARFIKILGSRVSLDEMEKALMGYFKTAQFVCVGEDDQVRVYCTAEGMEEQILRFCRKEFSIYRQMIECHFLKTLPHMDNGKVNYKKLI